MYWAFIVLACWKRCSTRLRRGDSSWRKGRLSACKYIVNTSSLFDLCYYNLKSIVIHLIGSHYARVYKQQKHLLSSWTRLSTLPKSTLNFTKQVESGRNSTVQMILQNGVSRLSSPSEHICIFFRYDNSTWWYLTLPICNLHWSFHFARWLPDPLAYFEVASLLHILISRYCEGRLLDMWTDIITLI